MKNINGNSFVKRDMSVNEYVGMVLSRIGFKSGDRIELRDRCYKNGVRTVCCVVNDEEY